MGYRGYGVQGVWGTWAIDHNGYRGYGYRGMRPQGVCDTWVMGHMGDGVHWHNDARSSSRCQNLRLPYFFLISELNTCPILMFEYSIRSLGSPLQESELKLPVGGL